MINKQKLIDWLKQTSTQYALAGQVITVGFQASGLCDNVLHGSLAVFLPYVNGALLIPLFPDNTTDRIKVQDKANKLIAAIVTKNPVAIKDAITDGIQTVGTLDTFKEDEKKVTD